MSVGSKLYAGKIECLVSKLVDNVRWLKVIACDKQPDLNLEIWLWWLILNTNLNKKPGSHWLAFFAQLARIIELFD